ncbi:tail fiber domain-containing protein [Pseudocitrobacter faecalis]
MGYTWNFPSASDKRLKYDIEYLSPDSCLDRILKMKSADYT